MQAKPNEILLTRIYNAPVTLVWDAWTDLEKVSKWWGPRGFTLTTKSKDLRPGGKWIYTMHGPDGTDYPNITTYHEVVPYKRLVYDHGGNDERQKLFTVTAEFREENGKTHLTMISTLPDEESAKAMKGFIKAAGGNSTWDRLGEFLDCTLHDTDPFIIERSFEANRKTLFDVFSNPDIVAKWLGPTGAKTRFLNASVKEGGSAMWEMTTDSGSKQGVLHLKSIKAPESVVYTQHFSDAQGKLIKAPFSASYPDELLTTVTLIEEAPNQTRVQVRWDIHGKANPNEQKEFHDMKPNMTIGWNQSFDKIDELLKR